MILQHYPKSERLQAVQAKNRRGESILFNAIANPESFKMILELYPEDQRLLAVKEKDESDIPLS